MDVGVSMNAIVFTSRQSSIKVKLWWLMKIRARAVQNCCHLIVWPFFQTILRTARIFSHVFWLREQTCFVVLCAFSLEKFPFIHTNWFFVWIVVVSLWVNFSKDLVALPQELVREFLFLLQFCAPKMHVQSFSRKFIICFFAQRSWMVDWWTAWSVGLLEGYLDSLTQTKFTFCIYVH